MFVGGAQALRLAQAYSRRPDASGSAQWTADRAAPSPTVAEALREADKIVWLATSDPQPRLDLSDLRAELIPLPELQLDFLWPFAGQPHIANAFDAFFPAGPFPAEFGDAWLNRALDGRSGLAAIAQTYLALDVARCVDLDRMKDMALERQAQADRLIGVDFASRIAEGFRRRALFASRRHPGPELFDLYAKAAFARLDVSYVPEPALPVRSLPIHPRVAAHFGLDAALLAPCPQDTGEPVDFPEYVRRYLAYFEGPELERGLALLGEGRFSEAGHALEIAGARPMGRLSRSARRGALHARLRAAGVEGPDLELAIDLGDPDYGAALAAFARGRWSEAERALLAYMAKAEATAADFVRLADIREKQADAPGALAALELAASLAPDDAGTATRLTLAHVANGDWLTAARAAEREIAVAPQNWRARVVLAHVLTRAGWRSRAAQEAEAALGLMGDAPELAALRDMLRAQVSG